MSRPLDEAKHRQANDVVVDDVMDDGNPMMRQFPAVLPPIPRVSSLTEALIVPLSRQSHEYNSVRFVAYSIHYQKNYDCGLRHFRFSHSYSLRRHFAKRPSFARQNVATEF